MGRRVGVDGRGVAAGPLAVGQGAHLHRHAQTVAGVVARAPHLGVVPRAPEVACPPLRVGLEAAAAEHHRARGQVLEPVGPARGHSGDASAAVLQQPLRRGVVAHLDAHALGDAEPHRGEPHALVPRADHRAGRPLVGVAHLDRGERDRGLHLDPLAGHPARGVVGAADQQLGQLGIGAPVGHPQEIGHEEAMRVRLDAGVEAGHLALRVRHQRAQVVGAVEGDAQEPSAVVGVAAAERARRLLQREHARRALLARRHRRGQGRVAGAHHDHVPVAHRPVRSPAVRWPAPACAMSRVRALPP